MAKEQRLIDVNAMVEKLEYEIETQCKPVADSDSVVEAFIKRVLPKLLRDVIKYIKQQPTVEAVEVVHGWWIEHKWAEEENGLLISNFECSTCHEWERKKSDYCPNCGADMRGEKQWQMKSG